MNPGAFDTEPTAARGRLLSAGPCHVQAKCPQPAPRVTSSAAACQLIFSTAHLLDARRLCYFLVPKATTKRALRQRCEAPRCMLPKREPGNRLRLASAATETNSQILATASSLASLSNRVCHTSHSTRPTTKEVGIGPADVLPAARGCACFT